MKVPTSEALSLPIAKANAPGTIFRSCSFWLRLGRCIHAPCHEPKFKTTRNARNPASANGWSCHRCDPLNSGTLTIPSHSIRMGPSIGASGFRPPRPCHFRTISQAPNPTRAVSISAISLYGERMGLQLTNLQWSRMTSGWASPKWSGEQTSSSQPAVNS